ncbi:sugar-transfer associated ATP-grasp domain-containing protein [Bacteroides bouchesdurhonensis]
MNKAYLRRFIFKNLKKSKLIFNVHEWICGYKDIRDKRAEYAGQEFKSPDRIKREKKIIKDYWHCGAFHYERYGLAYKDLSDDQILDYVPTFYHHVTLEKAHKGIDTVKYDNKLTQAELFAERGIPSADTIGVYHNGICKTILGDKKIDFEKEVKESISVSNRKVFLKEAGANGGFGIFVLKQIDGNFIINGQKSEFDQLYHILEKDKYYIVQKGIIQTRQLSSINETSVNTLRIVAIKEDGVMKLKTCNLRMGRSGKEVDNNGQRGMGVQVNIKDGSLAETATARIGGGTFYKHPDSNVVFKGFKINNWDEVFEKTERIASKLIDFNNVGLDIALTDEGPILVEFNFRYGIEQQQVVFGGVRKLLNIYPS